MKRWSLRWPQLVFTLDLSDVDVWVRVAETLDQFDRLRQGHQLAEDRCVRNAFLAHRIAQCGDAGIRIFRRQRVFRIRQAVMTARQPRVFIDHGGHQVGNLVVGPLPQRAKGARG